MRITYKLEKEDYFKFNLHHMENFPKVKRSITIQRFFMPVIFTLIAFLSYKRGRALTSILPLYLLIAGGWIFLYPRFLENSMKKRLNNILDLEDNKMLLEERTIEVNDKGIYEIVKDEEGNEKSLFSSDKIIDVEESGDSLYIYLTSESAYIIPVKFFEDKEKLDEFISKVEELKIENN